MFGVVLRLSKLEADGSPMTAENPATETRHAVFGNLPALTDISGWQVAGKAELG